MQQLSNQNHKKHGNNNFQGYNSGIYIYILYIYIYIWDIITIKLHIGYTYIYIYHSYIYIYHMGLNHTGYWRIIPPRWRVRPTLWSVSCQMQGIQDIHDIRQTGLMGMDGLWLVFLRKENICVPSGELT